LPNTPYIVGHYNSFWTPDYNDSIKEGDLDLIGAVFWTKGGCKIGNNQTFTPSISPLAVYTPSLVPYTGFKEDAQQIAVSNSFSPNYYYYRDHPVYIPWFPRDKRILSHV